MNKINGYVDESNRNRYLTLVPTDKKRHTEKYEKLWNKIRKI